MASAAALALGDRGTRVLVVSTDPASNPDEVFGTPVGPAASRVPSVPGVDVMNLDPDAGAAAYRERVIGPYRGVVSERELRSPYAVRRAHRPPSTPARTLTTQPEAWAPADDTPGAHLRAEQTEMSACVQGFVGELSDGYRAVLMLHDVHGLTCPEIAAALGESPGAVTIRLHRARKALRSSLQTACPFSHDERGALVCEPDR